MSSQRAKAVATAEHPFHLHGRAFEVLSVDGVAPAVRTVEDTVNVPIRGVVRLRWVPQREGRWLAHCHILPHMAGGMVTGRYVMLADAPQTAYLVTETFSELQTAPAQWIDKNFVRPGLPQRIAVQA